LLPESLGVLDRGRAAKRAGRVEEISVQVKFAESLFHEVRE
jgi:hypothetical protein